MIDLREHSGRIVAWLAAELVRFRLEHADVPSPHVALYCCPWSGWISLCLDPEAQLEQNCPDFEFVEFALYEAPEWAAQYEEDDTLTIVDADGNKHLVELASDGDEGLNHIFFEFLRSLLASRTREAITNAQIRPKRLGVQLLDSEYGDSWEPR